jgi:hypothetical protein
VIPAASIALSTLIDYFCECDLIGSAKALAIIGFMANTAALVGGLIGFLTISHDHHVLNDEELSIYSGMIEMALGIGFVTEACVSWSHGMFRRRLHNPAP